MKCSACRYYEPTCDYDVRIHIVASYIHHDRRSIAAPAVSVLEAKGSGCMLGGSRHDCEQEVAWCFYLRRRIQPQQQLVRGGFACSL